MARPILTFIIAAMLGSVGFAGQVELTVTERAGVDRSAEPVTSGVPIPKGELADAVHCRLLDAAGKEVPAQFRVAGRWHPDTSVRWLLVDFQADVKANQSARFTLDYGKDVTQQVAHKNGMTIKSADDDFTVSTGAATFVISRRSFSLFEEAKLADGTALVARPADGKPRAGAVLRGVQATVTRAIPDAKNTGRSHLIFVQTDPKCSTEDYTLTFTSDTAFQVSGSKVGKVGTGQYQKDFKATNGQVMIPGGAWLPYARPKAGDKYTFRTVAAGSDWTAEAVTSSEVIEGGSMRSVVQVKGAFGPASVPVLEFTARYHFHAGSPRVKLVFTLENNNHGGRTSSGNANNANIGGINCVFFDEMALQLPVSTRGETVGMAGDATDRKNPALLIEPLNAPAAIYQDSSGGANWNRYAADKFHPRPNSYVAFKGYRLLKGDQQVRTGERAAGFAMVGWQQAGQAGGVIAAVRDFWQNYPKSLSAEPGGIARIGLFPGRYAADFPLRSGEHKTHDVLLHFVGSESLGNAELAYESVAGFSAPLRAWPTPQWFANTGVLGDIHPRDPEHYAAYEVRNASTVGRFAEGVKPGPSLPSQIEKFEILGWMDYGDVPIDFEAASGQWGMKYDLDLQMARQWARTMDGRWWDLFVAADRHTRDIDIHHQPHYPGGPGAHYVVGGVWAHSLHNEGGIRNPNRNYNHFTKDLCFGARGTAALHYLTGDWKAREAALEIADNALAQYMSPQKQPDPADAGNNRMGVRGDACTLNRLLEGYQMTGEANYLERARWQMATCAFDGRPKGHKETSLWSSVFYMMALYRYVEMFPDDRQAREWLLTHIETLRKTARPGEGIYYTITPLPDGTVSGKGEVSHYNIMAADALAVGYRLTGDMKYMDAARLCFDYGVKNACWKSGPATYFHIHSANGATHGNFFMVEDSKLRAAGKKETP